MRLIHLLSFALISGCSLLKELKREIVITSQPAEAEVSYLAGTGEFKTLGKTPLTIDASLIKKWQDTHQEYAVVKVSKSGYVMENLFIDLKGRYKISYAADLKTIDVWNNKEMEISSTAANKLAVKVQQINQQIFSKNFPKALSSAEVLIEQFPKAHVFLDMKGSILLLMGKKSEALASYQKSLSLNPDNTDAKKMLQRITGDQQ